MLKITLKLLFSDHVSGLKIAKVKTMNPPTSNSMSIFSFNQIKQIFKHANLIDNTLFSKIFIKGIQN